MLRIIAPAALFAALLAAPAAAQERVVPVTDFDRIVVEGPYEVQLVRANVTRAAVSGPRPSIDSVSVEVQGQTLRVRRNPNNWSGNPHRRIDPPRITLSTRNLRSARIIGAGSLTLTGIQAQRLDLSVEGPGGITANGLQVDRLSAGIRGEGNMALAGTAARLEASVQGSGALDGSALRVEDATLTAATTGSVDLTARRTATITANGIGEVEVRGQAACTVRGPTAASVRCGPAR